MKKITLFFTILSFSFLKLSAQDWHVVKQHDTTYYTAGNVDSLYNPSSGTLLYMAIDSSKNINSDSIYYYYPTVFKLGNSNSFPSIPFPCVDTLGPTWLGKSSIRTSDGIEKFYSLNNDSLFIHTKSVLYDSWLLFTTLDSVDIVATTDSFSTTIIDGSMDSLKFIRLNTFKNGIPFVHFFENKYIVLSKNSGLYKGYKFSFFNEFNNEINFSLNDNIYRLDNSTYTKTVAERIIDIENLYQPGNYWVNTDYDEAWNGTAISNGYIHDSIISSQMITSSLREVVIRRRTRSRDYNGDLYTQDYNYIINFDYNTLIESNLLNGIYPYLNQTSNIYPLSSCTFCSNNVIYKFEVGYNQSENLFSLTRFSDGGYYFTQQLFPFNNDSCLKYRPASYFEYFYQDNITINNLFGTINSFYEENTAGGYVQGKGNESLALYRIGNTTYGSFPLSVSLLNLTAHSISSKENYLSWQTEKEENTNYFEIQYSMNGKDFMTIENQEAVKSSTGITNYSFHHFINNNDKTIFYRLKLVDIDGKYIYSNIVNVKNISNQEFSIYPNPFKDNINIGINSKSETNYSIQITNAVGVIVKKIAGNLVSGNNKIQINDLGNLASGIYYLQFTTEEKETKTYKLIKQ